MQSLNGNSPAMYALRDVPGKGKGLVAIQDIPSGTQILSEQPVITIPERHRNNEWLKTHISSQVDSLKEHQQQSFLSMFNLYPYQDAAEQYLSIIRTNSLPIDADGISGGIFLEACRINHACDNNAQKNWNQLLKRHTIYALRDILEGEEITIYYLGRDDSRAVRQERLQEKFGFQCCCRLCTLPTEESQESDNRLERIGQLDVLIGRDGMQMNFSLRTLRYADDLVRLYNEQGPGDAGLARTYLDAAQIVIANSDLARGRIFVERAVKAWQTANGSECKEVIEQGPLARNPAKLGLYGLSKKWQTSLNDVPQGLDTTDFEAWLWRRAKPKVLGEIGQLADLRDRETFPALAALPRSDDDLEWYEEIDGTCKPSRYWCFLGEIVSSRTLHHLELGLTSIDDEEVPLHFYTEGRGSDLAPAQIRKGYTVAVRYARRRVFVFGSPGIRHEDPKMLKVRASTVLVAINYLQFTHMISALQRSFHFRWRGY